jgi:carboxypeptidase C (cathepsin A)
MDNECKVFFNGVRNTTCKNQTAEPTANCSLCDDWMNDMTYYNIYGLNWYDLYRKAEAVLSEEERVGTTVIDGEVRKYQRGYTHAEYTPWLKHPHHQGGKQQVMGTFLSDYLNRDDVRKALHIDDRIKTWEMCNGYIGQNYLLNATAETSPSVWIYPVIRDAGIRMMFYSGDTDGAVSTYGSKLWINKMNFCVAADWKAWYTKGQVSGYIKQYEMLDFITIKGVGHMAPQWARKPMADLITSWIHKPASEILSCPHPEKEQEAQTEQFIQ